MSPKSSVWTVLQHQSRQPASPMLNFVPLQPETTTHLFGGAERESIAHGFVVKDLM
jgi:hypothetical protein